MIQGRREPTRTPSIVSTVDLNPRFVRIVTEPTEDGAFLTLLEGGPYDGERFTSDDYQAAQELHRQLDRWAALVSNTGDQGSESEAARIWHALTLAQEGQGRGCCGPNGPRPLPKRATPTRGRNRP